MESSACDSTTDSLKTIAKIVQRKQNCGGPGEIHVEFEGSMIDGVAIVINMDFYRENEEPVVGQRPWIDNGR